MRFRERTIGAPVVQLKDRADLVAYLKRQFEPWPDLDDTDFRKLKTEPYGVFNKDGPTGWTGRAFLVTLPEYGVVGYADEPL